MHAPFNFTYLLEPDITFLNHGSYGACTEAVFADYQRWQRRLEAQPVRFLGRELPHLLNEARNVLGRFLGTSGDNLAFVPNATLGVNIVARSLDLQPGDEVLATDHEYGAVNNMWRLICKRRGARYIEQPIPLPLISEAAFVDALWAGVTERTRVIAISHITSPTALIFPVGEVCRRAREAGIITVIDGAHAPGHIDLELDSLDADFYAGNSHKWLGSAKGSGFLYVTPNEQERLVPLVVSHGMTRDMGFGSPFRNRFGWTGTADPAAHLSVPAAVAQHQSDAMSTLRAHCRELARSAKAQLVDSLGTAPLSDDVRIGQMAAVPLPDSVCSNRAEPLRAALWNEHRVEIPIVPWKAGALARISIAPYNDAGDVERLIEALGAVL